jgi:hypothetical protein
MGQKNCPYEIFVKLEQGRPTLLKLFRDIAINFMMNYRDVYFTVLVDHDGRDQQRDIDDILNSVKSKNNYIFFSEPTVTKVTEDVQRRDLFIQKKVGTEIKNLYKFSITSFKRSLEISVSKGQERSPVKDQIVIYSKGLDYREIFGRRMTKIIHALLSLVEEKWVHCRLILHLGRHNRVLMRLQDLSCYLSEPS